MKRSLNAERTEAISYDSRSDDPGRLSDSHINAIYEDTAGDLWIGTENGGLNRFDRLKDRFDVCRHDPRRADSLTGNRITVIIEDRSNMLWLGTGQGLNRFGLSRQPFNHYSMDPKDPDGPSGDIIWDMVEDRDGQIWIATRGAGLNRFNPETGVFLIMKSNDVDENRLEQEIIFYLEKIDITEEKIRLKNHCDYFLETMESSNSPGKKLGFISQEIGREINTLGAKANHADIQKLVVEMKDELEKIKEQVLNVL